MLERLGRRTFIWVASRSHSVRFPIDRDRVFMNKHGLTSYNDSIFIKKIFKNFIFEFRKLPRSSTDLNNHIKNIKNLRQVSGIKYLNKMSTYHLACGDSEITWVEWLIEMFSKKFRNSKILHFLGTLFEIYQSFWVESEWTKESSHSTGDT